MPRIRTIKPEFWADEKLSTLEPIDRLVFLGLISLADDYGRVHDVEKVIDAFVFPNTSHSVRESLANLSRMVRVRRGNASSGKPILEIVNWSRHQRVDKPQPKMALPPIDAKTNENIDATTVREPFANDSGMVRELVAPRPTTNDLRPTSNDLFLGSVSSRGKRSNCPEQATGRKKSLRFEEQDKHTAEWMLELIRSNVLPSYPDKDIDSWANEIRLMRERDKKTDAEIRDLFGRANADEFWKKNILCPATLREKWTKLEIKLPASKPTFKAKTDTVPPHILEKQKRDQAREARKMESQS